MTFARARATRARARRRVGARETGLIFFFFVVVVFVVSSDAQRHRPRLSFTDSDSKE